MTNPGTTMHLSLITTTSPESADLLVEVIADLEERLAFDFLAQIEGVQVIVHGTVTNTSGRADGDFWRDTGLTIARAIASLTGDQQLLIMWTLDRP